MKTRDDVQSLQLEVKFGDYTNFILVVSKDNCIQRYGPVEPGDTGDLKMVVVQEPFFESFVASVPDYVFELLNRRFQCSEQIVGQACSLALTFEDGRGSLAGIRFDYGKDSQGPPAEVWELFLQAQRATDSWYNAQQ